MERTQKIFPYVTLRQVRDYDRALQSKTHIVFCCGSRVIAYDRAECKFTEVTGVKPEEIRSLDLGIITLVPGEDADKEQLYSADAGEIIADLPSDLSESLYFESSRTHLMLYDCYVAMSAGINVYDYAKKSWGLLPYIESADSHLHENHFYYNTITEPNKLFCCRVGSDPVACDVTATLIASYNNKQKYFIVTRKHILFFGNVSTGDYFYYDMMMQKKIAINVAYSREQFPGKPADNVIYCLRESAFYVVRADGLYNNSGKIADIPRGKWRNIPPIADIYCAIGLNDESGCGPFSEFIELKTGKIMIIAEKNMREFNPVCEIVFGDDRDDIADSREYINVYCGDADVRAGLKLIHK